MDNKIEEKKLRKQLEILLRPKYLDWMASLYSSARVIGKSLEERLRDWSWR